MIDKVALAQRFSGYADIFNEGAFKDDLKAMSFVLERMSDNKFEELINKEAFRLPGMEKLKGFFRAPGQAPQTKPGEYTKTPTQRATDIREKFRESGLAGKLLSMFEHKDVQNAYTALPEEIKKLVNRYTKKWQTLDLVGKAAAEEKEALFGDKGPAATYKALDNVLTDFSKRYDVSSLPTVIADKFNELMGHMETLEKSPEKLPKSVSPEEEVTIEEIRQKSEGPVTDQDIEDDKRINKFLQVIDKHYKTELQRSLSPKLKAEYERMVGDIVGRLKGDIEQGFRGSSPGATYSKKSPYVPRKAPAPSPEAPVGESESMVPVGTPGGKGQGRVVGVKSASEEGDKSSKGTLANDTVIASEGVFLTPRMMEIDELSDEIKKLSIILANNKL